MEFLMDFNKQKYTRITKFSGRFDKKLIHSIIERIKMIKFSFWDLIQNSVELRKYIYSIFIIILLGFENKNWQH